MREMQRRTFLTAAGAAAAAPLPGAVPPKTTTRKALMKVGTQHADDDASLKILAAFGVNNICSTLFSKTLDDKWSVDSLKRLRERVESHGVALDMVPLPKSSSPIARF
jgi:mannonate dehydratase